MVSIWVCLISFFFFNLHVKSPYYWFLCVHNLLQILVLQFGFFLDNFIHGCYCWGRWKQLKRWKLKTRQRYTCWGKWCTYCFVTEMPPNMYIVCTLFSKCVVIQICTPFKLVCIPAFSFHMIPNSIIVSGFFLEHVQYCCDDYIQGRPYEYQIA